MSDDPGPQLQLDVGERSQAEYDFIAEAIARFEDGIEVEQLRQAAREPYHPSGLFGAFTETDLKAAIAAGLEHAELRVFLVHVIEFAGRGAHTTAAAIIRAKAGRSPGVPCGRHTYQRANRKLRDAGIIAVVQRGAGRAAMVRRPEPRLTGLEPSARALRGQAEPSARALRGQERRGTGELPERATAAVCVKCHGPTDFDASGEPWRVCPGCNPRLSEARRAAWFDRRAPAVDAGPAPLFTDADAVRDALHRGEGVEL